MKWLLKNNISYNELTFAYASLNGNLKNLLWLLDNKFPFDIILLVLQFVKQI
jgi:hypothetical protein